MKPQLALILLTLAACREQPEQKATPPDRLPARPSPSASTPAQDTRPNKPLLKTPRITITDTGSGRFYPVIRDAAQAEATLADIRSLPPSAARDSATAGIIGDLAKVDPAAARRLFEAWDGGLIEAWLPPADRVAHIESLPEGSEKIRIAGDLVHVWLAEDPAACARWLDGFVQGRDPDELRELTTSVHNSFAPDADTAHRLTALRTATDPRLRELLAEYLWKKADAAERAELFTEIEQDIPDLAQRDRQSAIAAAPAAFAASLSPAQAAELPTDEMKVIIERWAATQPAAAFRWALDHQRPEAALALDPLYREEPRQALELAAQLKPGKERDTALASLCAAAAFHGHADLARPLLPLIENPAQREATTRNVEEHAGKAAR
jgi:hypothetical protein